MIEAPPKHFQTEGNEMMRAHIPMGNEEPQDIFNRHGFKRSRVADFDRTLEGQIENLQSRISREQQRPLGAGWEHLL